MIRQKMDFIQEFIQSDCIKETYIQISGGYHITYDFQMDVTSHMTMDTLTIISNLKRTYMAPLLYPITDIKTSGWTQRPIIYSIQIRPT